MYKKSFFVVLFLLTVFVPTHTVSADFATDADCEAVGGTCNGPITYSNSCDSDEDNLGLCTSGWIDSACCIPKSANTSQSMNITTKYTPLENIPFINGTSFQTYVQGLYQLGLVLVVLSAVFMLVVGGFMYLTSAGNTSAISSAKHVIQGALFGLVLALVSYVILNTINSDLTNVNVSTFQPLALRSSGGGSTSGGGGSTGGGGSCTPIPDSDLVTVQGFQMLQSTATNFNAMKAAAAQAGITLTLTSGYRSPDRQLELWNQYGCSRSSGRTICNGGKSVAVPCSLGGNGSNHSRGDAVDINVGCSNGQAGCNTPTYRWLKANGFQWNFKNSVPTDPVHWSPSGN